VLLSRCSAVVISLLFRGFRLPNCGQNVCLSKVLIGIHPVAALARNSGA